MGHARVIVLAGGILGLVSLFMPYLVLDAEGTDTTIRLSPYVAFAGISSAHDVFEGPEFESMTDQEKEDPEVAAAWDEADAALGPLKMVFLIPLGLALALVVFGVLGMRGSFGRGLGAGSLSCGLLALAFWGLLSAGMESAEAEVSAGIGLILLMACGALAAVGGLLALIKPEPKRAAA